jgi:hypothetical protein
MAQGDPFDKSKKKDANKLLQNLNNLTFSKYFAAK